MQRGNLCCTLLLAFACIGLARAQTIPTQCPCVPGTRNPSTHALTCFPFCNCNDYKPSSSPWLLTIVDISESASGVSVTFQLTNVSSVPTTPSPCFKNFSANGIQKIQVDTFTTCNDANTDIFIGSTLCTGGCKVESPASYTNQRYFRVGSFTAKQAYAGTTFTIVGRGACGTLATLLKAPAGQVFSYTIYKEFASNFICCPTGCGEFPPPPVPLPPASGTIPPPPSPPPPTRPPPAPPALFPHQSCKPGNIGSTTLGGIKGVPYNIDIRRVSSYSGAGTTGEHYCWVVKPQACRTSSSYPGCCDISLDKIELAVKEGCRNNAALKNIYAFGGKGSVALSSSTGFVPGTANTPSTIADVIKFTAIKYQNGPASLATITSLAAAGQNLICFTIDPTRKCGTGATLFLQPPGLSGGVEYAYWGTKPSSTAQCCGTEFTPLT